MANQLIFLSHIHEERELAVLIKNAVQEEFGGFIDVFVSSDGTTIPAGANFLSRIEDGLATCAAAIYLISPKSVKRNWINFELGAVWIRNVLNQPSAGTKIPTIPFCHSGSTPSELPAPLNNLNGIIATESSQLEFAFRSLQSALGGKGALRTDFDKLAAAALAFQTSYTIGASISRICSLVGGGTFSN
ncbi:toll/interleukin-1 receptor domain-containing protein [Pleomorphomonas koreensis]|uniref:toll/interleukin-1 receptor domain-containing protein n=1 Tax=Pleomorphomonas koreensis TaxID=257440 RepID=UPI00146C367C|nr:toll/interleukin-1 receptor domain-containing protein [Pleomorphomonas koreensis]